jgi:hypothetical protein
MLTLQAYDRTENVITVRKAFSNESTLYKLTMYPEFDCISQTYYYQYPVIPCYAVTIHKLQGLTIPTLIGKMDDKFHQAGQTYTLLSRVRRMEDLFLMGFDITNLSNVSERVVEQGSAKNN